MVTVKLPPSEQQVEEVVISTIALPQIDQLAEEADVPTVELPRGDPELDGKDDLYRPCRQRISKEGRILVSKKAWVVRALSLSGITFFMLFNLVVAWTSRDLLIFYAILIPMHTLIVFVVGWLFFKNRAKGKVPEDLVSVIVPVYNQEGLIGDVVRAIFRSSYPNIEVVAVNDGSKDNTGRDLDFLAEEYPKLKVIHQANGGKRKAVATGFYTSQGKFVVLIDSDSVVDERAIEELMKTFSANPKVGGAVGNCKVLNADKNFLTKCQDAWYDYAFNIHKTTESMFGTVLCCSGCLSAYRREAIAQFIPYWAEAKVQNSDDRDLTSYAMATPWAKSELMSISGQLKKAMSRYDDSEDRGLTAHTLTTWDTVYVPSAVVYTEVPEKARAYIRQQTRWKKGYIRSCFYVSAFFWKKHPLMSLIFYTEFMTTFISPAILFSVYFYAPFIRHLYLVPLAYFAGQLLIGLAAGLDYKFRQPDANNWKYKPLMNLIASFLLPWLIFPALWTFRKNRWLTR
ncbi:glycosyltransferase [Chloroflexota bacterium]